MYSAKTHNLAEWKIYKQLMTEFDDDFEELMKDEHWHVMITKSGPRYYMCRSSKVVKRSRIAWIHFNQRPLKYGMHVHHIDGNTKNDSDSRNLIAVTASQHQKVHKFERDKFRIRATELGAKSGFDIRCSHPRHQEWNGDDTWGRLSWKKKDLYPNTWCTKCLYQAYHPNSKKNKALRDPNTPLKAAA